MLDVVGFSTNTPSAITDFIADCLGCASGGRDGSVDLWATESGSHIITLRPDRPYERMDITGISGITDAQKTAMKALGAVERLSD